MTELSPDARKQIDGALQWVESRDVAALLADANTLAYSKRVEVQATANGAAATITDNANRTFTLNSVNTEANERKPDTNWIMIRPPMFFHTKGEHITHQSVIAGGRAGSLGSYEQRSVVRGELEAARYLRKEETIRDARGNVVVKSRANCNVVPTKTSCEFTLHDGFGERFGVVKRESTYKPGATQWESKNDLYRWGIYLGSLSTRIQMRPDGNGFVAENTFQPR